MDNPVQNAPIASPLGTIPEHPSAKGWSVQWASFTFPVVIVIFVGKEEIRCRRPEILDDGFVPGGSWLDDAAGEGVGVDYGEGVGG